MNCDQVFDILTRGPFPTGTECDAGVEAHLNACGECRRLAEALRPAVELFQEAIGPEESRDLPGYWCAVQTDGRQPAVSYVEPRSESRARPQAWRKNPLAGSISAVAVWRLAAMLILGVTLGSLMHARVSLEDFTASGATAGSGTLPPAHSVHSADWSESDRAMLAVLPAACTRHRPVVVARDRLPGETMLATPDLSNLACCSECHHAHSDVAPKSATALVAARCQLCHHEPGGP